MVKDGALCIDNRGQEWLEVGRVYKIVDDPDLDERDIRIIDESDEDYIYPAESFEVVDMCKCGFCEFEDSRSKEEWDRFSAFYLKLAEENDWTLGGQSSEEAWDKHTRGVVAEFDRREGSKL